MISKVRTFKAYSDQVRTFKAYSEHFKRGSLADDIMTALARAAENRKVNHKDLGFLEDAEKYVGLIEEGLQIKNSLPEEIRVALRYSESEQIKAYNLYVEFALQRRIRDIPFSINQMKYELERARKGDIADKEELQFTRDFFHYLLRYNISEMDELDYW